MTLKTIEDLERLEKRVMQVAGQETELLLDRVCTPGAVDAAVSDEAMIVRQKNYKKNVANTYLLCERILRYIVLNKTLGKRNLEGMDEINAEIERAQRKATEGVTGAKARLKLVGGQG